MTEVANIAVWSRGLSKTFPMLGSAALAFIYALGGKQEASGHDALRGVDLNMAAGKALGLIGPNGSGKTTFLRILAGLSRLTSGECRVEGKVNATLSLTAGLVDRWTGRENCIFRLRIAGCPAREISTRVEEMIKFAELEDAGERPVRTFSSGMKARIAFSICTHLEGDLFLIDETLAVGDEHFRGKCLARFRELISAGKSAVIVSHDRDQILRVCDEAIQLEKGEVVRRGNAFSVVRDYEMATVKSAYNFLSEGHLTDDLVVDDFVFDAKEGKDGVEITGRLDLQTSRRQNVDVVIYVINKTQMFTKTIILRHGETGDLTVEPGQCGLSFSAAKVPLGAGEYLVGCAILSRPGDDLLYARGWNLGTEERFTIENGAPDALLSMPLAWRRVDSGERRQ